MIRPAILLLLVVAVTLGVRSFLPDDAITTGTTLAAGFLLLVAIQAGHVFHALRLPHLTGYILCGLVVGPEVLGLLTPAMLADLGTVKSVAVGLIALLAGCELNLRVLRPRLREIGVFSVAGLAGAAALLLPLLVGVSYLLPFGEGMGLLERLLVALVSANALCAFSPPVVIGILTEARAKGALSELWISIVVLADLAIVLSFSLTSSIAQTVFPGASGEAHLWNVLVHILASLGVGAGVGGVLMLFITRVGERVGLFVFAVLFVVAQAGAPFEIDPLLAGLAAGLILENLSPVSGESVIRDTEPAALPTFALFFAVIGAEVHLDEFLPVAPLAVAAALARAAGLFGGVAAGGRWMGSDPKRRRLVAFGMLPQAGIAIALASAIKTTFDPWGVPVGNLLLGTVVVNELVGPVIFRLAVGRSGEAGLRHDHPLAEHAPHAAAE